MSGSAQPLTPEQHPDVPAGVVDTVTISIVRDPALVRTVRLVAAAVARRAMLEESSIEEIRLAVGEACAVMIGTVLPHAADSTHLAGAADQDGAATRDQVVVRLAVDGGIDAAVEGRLAWPSSDLDGLDLDPWALLHGLSDQVSIEQGAGRTTVRMAWPAGSKPL